jgi:type VI protein secretion system component Hcp
MIPNRSKRGISNRFRPAAEALEDRSLMAVGQISLYIPNPAFDSPFFAPIRGSLPDGSIDVQQFNVGSVNPSYINSTTGTLVPGRTSFSPLEIVVATGPQSAGLFQAETLGATFDSARLTVRNTAAQVIEILSFNLVVVTSDTISGSNGSAPSEDLTFQYGSIQVTTMNPATNTPTSQGSYNLVLNQPSYNLLTIESESLAKASTANVSAQTVSAKAVSSAAPTTIKLTVAKPNHGKTLLTAKVASKHGVPTGNVTFYSGKLELGQVAVGANGKAALSVSTALLGKNKPFAIYSGGPDSTFQPATTITDEPAFEKNFEKWLGRPMTEDEWVLTSIWSQQGYNPAKMNSIYQSLATSSS